MRLITLVVFIFIQATPALGQNTLIWKKDKVLSFSNFKCQINESFDTSYFKLKSHVSFNQERTRKISGWFRKNSNQRFISIIYTDSSLIVAKDTLRAIQLLDLASFQFDLAEYYSRLMRKNGFESPQFLVDPDQTSSYGLQLNDEYENDVLDIYNVSDYGKKNEIVRIEHDKLRVKIKELELYCFECKSPH
ncbi:hypothetical protein SAMN04488029_3648 [Reichenbachiella faecimaris]|uniref:Uncharacterized protein n=1 Tax=Reichenbachiella faecimaris TaxID=692418 RepID=A0A1W2GNA6_REIFA|nr:hypothetical protein [Reichenbachiella faecimaris]SMD38135.1 hypothetical protein SAMN04488029_3648 [Reichenbachiella faecimaris]